MVHKNSSITTEYAFTAVFEPEAEGYRASFPALAHLSARGRSLDETRQAAAACLRAYLAGLQEQKRPLPESEGHRRQTLRDVLSIELEVA